MRKFKFFEGLDEYTFVLNVDGRLRALWEPEERLEIDVVDEVTNAMTQQILEEIDEDIIRTLTRRINGGDNHGIDYLNHWLRIGDNRA